MEADGKDLLGANGGDGPPEATCQHLQTEIEKLAVASEWLQANILGVCWGQCVLSPPPPPQG